MSSQEAITQDQVMPLLLNACPTFREVWDSSENQDLLYVCLGGFAHHLLHMYKERRTDEFPAVCEVIERLHLEGTCYVKEAATVGFLEGVQNAWADEVAPEEFFRFLLPESRKWWKELNDFWDGKIPHLGAGLSGERDVGDPRQIRT